MTWSAGPRLAFNFGFTDLGAGRYLEAWVPANLIFDQFDARHRARAAEHGDRAYRDHERRGRRPRNEPLAVAFPARFTALSTLLEVRADGHASSAHRHGDAADDRGRVRSRRGSLRRNRSTSRRRSRTSRVPGSDERTSAATCTATASSRSLTSAAWSTRAAPPLAGLPATRDLPQLVGARREAGRSADGWWDEAWNVYNDSAAPASLPLDFTDPPVELSSRNPWTRHHAAGAPIRAASDCSRGLLRSSASPRCKAHMSAFFAEHTRRPATTAELETLLVRRSGRRDIVDAFHRFVYGFPDPHRLPISGSRTTPAIPGSNFWAGTVLGLARPVDPQRRRRRHHAPAAGVRSGQLVPRPGAESERDCDSAPLRRHVQRQAVRRHRVRLPGRLPAVHRRESPTSSSVPAGRGSSRRGGRARSYLRPVRTPAGWRRC